MTSASMAVCISSRTPSPGDLLQDLTEVTLRSEKVVDVSVDALDRGYSSGHGCGFLSLLVRLERNLRPPSIYTGVGRHPVEDPEQLARGSGVPTAPLDHKPEVVDP